MGNVESKRERRNKRRGRKTETERTGTSGERKCAENADT